ncbi:acyl-CoA dehydrogenase family protein [Roseomonas sp. NAR14]|uniref:Acyl-CoA dehydrogenase family protein n=1 Tax=Roseomonas acroporae TaxID=2937791 RepID=A0A9X1Y6T4_9PROT|nr:acyl-CoA dehydrogenase family protein [Roseomonas acroporae]MCK8784163.1 acyl-CoA dehydrogenase family protein [Roseomonas acroporae]
MNAPLDLKRRAEVVELPFASPGTPLAAASAAPAPRDPVALARALVPLIEAHAPRIEQERAITPEVLDALHAAGLFRCLIPRDQGGDELDPATHVRMIEQLARGDGSVAWCVNQASGCSMSAASVSPEVARAVWGDPRAALAWGFGPAGRVRPVEGGWLVSGTWQFASGSRHANFLGGHCQLLDADGTPRRGPDGAPLERTALFPRAAAEIRDVWQVMGLRGTGSDTYAVTDLFVPEGYVYDREAVRTELAPGPLYRFTSTHLYAAGFAGVALGLARASLDALVALARKKTPSQAARSLRDSPVLQGTLAQAEARLRGARAGLLEALREAWEATLDADAVPMDHRAAIRMATTWAIHEAAAVVSVCWREAGATAIFESNPFERRFRDVNAVTQQLQGRLAHFESVGQHMLGLAVPARAL